MSRARRKLRIECTSIYGLSASGLAVDTSRNKISCNHRTDWTLGNSAKSGPSRPLLKTPAQGSPCELRAKTWLHDIQQTDPDQFPAGNVLMVIAKELRPHTG